jgi:hypothetical protein
MSRPATVSTMTDEMRLALETGEGLDERDLSVAAIVTITALEETARTRLVAFCLRREREAVWNAVEATLESAYFGRGCDPATLSVILRSIRSARRA